MKLQLEITGYVEVKKTVDVELPLYFKQTFDSYGYKTTDYVRIEEDFKYFSITEYNDEGREKVSMHFSTLDKKHLEHMLGDDTDVLEFMSKEKWEEAVRKFNDLAREYFE